MINGAWIQIDNNRTIEDLSPCQGFNCKYLYNFRNYNLKTEQMKCINLTWNNNNDTMNSTELNYEENLCLNNNNIEEIITLKKENYCLEWFFLKNVTTLKRSIYFDEKEDLQDNFYLSINFIETKGLCPIVSTISL